MSEDCEAELSNIMQFLYACPVGLVDFDGDGTIGMMNPMAMQMLRGLDGRPFASNFFTSLESCGPELRNLAEAFAPPRGEVCAQHRMIVRDGSADGTEEPKVFACTLVKLSSQRFIATLMDVSRQVAQERRLKQAETWFSTLLGNAEDFVGLQLDADGRIVGAEPAILVQMGLDQDEVLGATLNIFDAPPFDPQEISPAAADLIALTRRDGWHLDESWVRQADGGRRRCQRLIVVRSEGDGVIHGYTAVLRTMAGQGFDTATLQRLLRTDHLTGACNRARFFEVAERELQISLRTDQPLAAIAVDVDHFKGVNDTYGHGIGDKVLKAIATACTAALRPGDTFARIGGEEFVVLLPRTDLSQAKMLAEQLRAAVMAVTVSTPVDLLHVTASFGCAALTSSTRSLADLLAKADEGLYVAKRAGRNRVGVADRISAVA